MKNVGVILKALVEDGATGCTALHETVTPAVFFTTECGKVYRVDFDKAPPPEKLDALSAKIEAETGLKVDWAGFSRDRDQRDRETAAEDEASRAASAAETAAAKPVDTQAHNKPKA